MSSGDKNKINAVTVPPETTNKIGDEHPPFSNLTESQASRSLRFAIGDGVFYALMTGFGENYIGAYAVYLSATHPQIALIASLPQFLGALFQFFSVSILNFLNRRKTIILLGVTGQAATGLMILAIPLFSKEYGLLCLMGSVIAYHVFGGLANPPWNSLMGDLVNPNQRGAYFGTRNRWMSVANFGAICVAGIILHQTARMDNVALGFGVIFLTAVVARFISASYISQMTEPKYTPRPEDDFSLWQFIRHGRETNFGKFVTYTALMHFSVMISGPFITPYLLRDLKFSYLQFMLASAAVVLAQFLTLQLWGRFGDRFGNKKILTITGLLLTIIPIFWFFAKDLYTTIAIQFFAGIVWAGFTLSMGNFVFDTVSPPKRAQCVAIYNSANALGILLGATLGGFLSRYLPSEIHLADISVQLISNLQLLFFISASVRLLVSLKFLPALRETRDVQPFIAKDLSMLIAQINPIFGRKTDEE